ncbi:uncharacterized protein PGTG_10175 [Puccinia graminis f. sp. tritici CRL 75-36-700-3]|uniref:Uncharacterized protein n=1 Tax=Puccinia graminis f. sp. tritici (strain CRL 75-36-700-3 / race SCCL) TaxID=418459 RepID=E3KJI0_PUCGT|nr:uncharacterized protein PGTG_10175 [Puccinia graminis f. sp. tritici CRL 75-36-700-3]EFP84455.1 hypothetical protein PGTG_10175 [Puccinia graminis f. sp. tritici CRL 75-36-700-3]
MDRTPTEALPSSRPGQDIQAAVQPAASAHMCTAIADALHHDVRSQQTRPSDEAHRGRSLAYSATVVRPAVLESEEQKSHYFKRASVLQPFLFTPTTIKPGQDFPTKKSSVPKPLAPRFNMSEEALRNPFMKASKSFAIHKWRTQVSLSDVGNQENEPPRDN